MKRKLLCCLLAAMTIVTGVFSHIFATPVRADAATVWAEDITAHRNESITVAVTLRDEIVMKSGAISLAYDKEVLQLRSGSWDISNAVLATFDMKTELGAFLYANETTLRGTVFTATFSVLADAAFSTSDLQFTLQLKDKNSNDLEAVNVQYRMNVECAHEYSAWETSATQHKHTCSICGNEEIEDHTSSNWIVTKNATCEETGFRVKKCLECETLLDSEVILTTEHTWSEWKKVDENQHSRSCECGETQTEEHHWDDGKITKQPSPTEEGVKEFTCADCQATRTESLAKTTEHTWSEWKKVDENQHSRSCECGETQTEEHHWDDGKITKQPSHIEEGVKEFTCSDCQATRTESLVMTTEHTWSEWKKVDENQHGRSCECGETQTEEHHWDEGVEIKKPTATQEGEKEFKCEICDAQKIEKVKIADEQEEKQADFPWIILLSIFGGIVAIVTLSIIVVIVIKKKASHNGDLDNDHSANNKLD